MLCIGSAELIICIISKFPFAAFVFFHIDIVIPNPINFISGTTYIVSHGTTYIVPYILSFFHLLLAAELYYVMLAIIIIL